MNRKTSGFLSVAILLLLLVFSPVVAAQDAVVAQEVETEMRSSEEPVEVLVTLDEPKGMITPNERKAAVTGSQRTLLDRVESADGARVLKKFWIANAVLVEVEPGYDHTELARVDEVRSLEPNTETEILGSALPSAHDTGALTAPTEATTPTATTSYGVDQINAPEVWSQYGTKGGGVKVAVLDTGVNVSHPDIDLRTTDPSDPTYPGGWAEFDSQGNRITGSTPYDSEGHGTHVSGTVAGENTGVAPGVDLMHGLVVNGKQGTVSQALSGMEWAVNNDADVVTMSLGGNTDDTWINAVENANDMGVTVVAASGNDGDGTSASPGNVYDTLSVGAVDSNLDVPSFSGGEVIDTDATWGNSALEDWPESYVVPDVVAAGVGINSTSADGGYTKISGTSMATPHVAGATALALSGAGSSAPDRVTEAFSLTAFGSGSEDPGTRYGYGAADALAVTDHLADDASVSGTVVDGSGTPIEEAKVSVEGLRVDSTGGSYSVGLTQGTWSIEASAPGYKDKTETVSLTQDENAAKDVVLKEPEPATFEVSDLNGPTKAEPGESVTVTAKITNTGDVSGTQDVTVRLAENGTPLDGSAVVGTRSGLSLGAGSSDTVGFTVSAPNSEGEYDYGVFTDDTSATGTVTVEDPPRQFFEVENLRAPTEAEVGESVTATATVRNTGDASGTQDVTFRLAQKGAPLDGSAVVGTRSGLSLGPGESSGVTFGFDAPNSEGDFDHGVFSDDDTETATLTVEQPPPEQANFEVSNLKAPGKVEEKERFEVNATVENTGGISDTQDVTFRLNDSGEPLDGSAVVETRTGVSLASGEKTTVEFEKLSVDKDGSFDHGVFTDDGSAEKSLTVEDREPAFFEVSNLKAPGTAKAGEDTKVNATVTNTGGISDTQDVTFRLNDSGKQLDSGAVVNTENVGLSDGASTTVEFTVSVPAEEGDYRHGVFTDDENETATLTVESRTDEGALSDDNPFGDANDEPLRISDAADVLFEWNQNNGTVDGMNISLSDMADFLFGWNQART